MMSPSLAIYLRLSKDDVDIKGNALKDESDSIHSQRLIVRQYIESQDDLRRYSIVEFADDGYTGTNFDRPDFQRMMSMIRKGDIDCIVVKDLSRFGRNYLEVGDFLEHLFPFLGVRFIAVNDNYDSKAYIGTTAGIDVAFRNLVYQRYSQDLSEKVKSAMHLKMSKGQYVTHCPYGYMKKPGEKHKMYPDPETAPIVREIFLSAAAGKKTTEIAFMLNERKVPTPMVYKQLSREGMHNHAMWSHQAIIRIIKDYKYTGAMVNFKCENATIRASVQRRCSPDEWVIVENSHEPIVSHEEYQLANSSLRKVSPSPRGKNDCKDRIYYCAYCGRRLRKTYGNDEYYSCASKLYLPDSSCAKVRWSRTQLEDVILSAYKAQLLLMDRAFKKAVAQPDEAPLIACRNGQVSIEKELNASDKNNLSLYEQYRGELLSKEDFLQKKTELQHRKKALQAHLVQLQAEEQRLIVEERKTAHELAALKEASDKLSESDEVLKEQMYDDIEKIIVFADSEVNICWGFTVDYPADAEN